MHAQVGKQPVVICLREPELSACANTWLRFLLAFLVETTIPLSLHIFCHQIAATILEIGDEYLGENGLSDDEREGTAHFVDLMAEWTDWLLNCKKEMNESGLIFNVRMNNLFSRPKYREDVNKKCNKRKNNHTSWSSNPDQVNFSSRIHC